MDGIYLSIQKNITVHEHSFYLMEILKIIKLNTNI